MKTLTIKTHAQTSMIDITDALNAYIKERNVKDGVLYCFVPHTTAALTINENADPTVQEDMLYGFDKIAPDDPAFRHLEGNSAAHIKASLVGASETILIENGQLCLGVWQGVYFCEFDGPRTRQCLIKIV